MLATHIVKAYATEKPIIKVYQDGLAKTKLHIVLDYIDSHLEQDIKLSDLAKLIEVNQYYFCTLFKQSTGLAPPFNAGSPEGADEELVTMVKKSGSELITASLEASKEAAQYILN